MSERTNDNSPFRQGTISMENIDALQAIERGEKQDQETLLRLKDEELVDLRDVPNT